MASWGTLPVELKLLVFEAIEEIATPPRKNTANGPKRGALRLAPLATVCSEWRDAVEAITFRSLAVKTGDVHDFEGYFLQNLRRQAVLRHVCLVIDLPRYPTRLSCVGESEEDQDANDSVFSDTLWHFFAALSSWNADALLRAHQAAGAGIVLELLARSPSDKSSLFGERGIAETGESRYFDSRLDINIAAMHDPHGLIGLPEVSVITTFCILRQNHRFFTARSLLHIVHSLPRLAYLDLELWHHFTDEAQRQADQDFSVNVAFWPKSIKKLTLFRFNDAFNMDEEVWGHDVKYPFFARRIAEFSEHLEELAVADFIDADHFFERFYTPHRRLRIPVWDHLRLLTLTSTTICSNRAEEAVQKLLLAAGLAARRMPALYIMEIYNAETNEAGLFRYLAGTNGAGATSCSVDRSQSGHGGNASSSAVVGAYATASIFWQSSWEYRIPDDVRQAWTAAAQQSHNRMDLVVLPEIVLDGYDGRAWFVHSQLMTRPALLHPSSSRQMMSDSVRDYHDSYRKLMRAVPRPSRHQRELEEVQNKLRFYTAELERLQGLSDDADEMDLADGYNEHIFTSDPNAMYVDDDDDAGARIEIMYQDEPPDADEGQPAGGHDEDDDAWETE